MPLGFHTGLINLLEKQNVRGTVAITNLYMYPPKGSSWFPAIEDSIKGSFLSRWHYVFWVFPTYPSLLSRWPILTPRESDLYHEGYLPFLFCILSLIRTTSICLASAMVWIVSPPKSIGWNQVFNAMVFSGGAFGRGLSREGGALMNEISALVRVPRKLPPDLPFCPVRTY